VAPLLGAVLDPTLFNVSELIREGYDDAHSATLPLIVQHGSGALAAPLASGAKGGRQLHALGAVVARQPKTSLAQLGAAMAAPARAARQAQARAAATAPEVAGAKHVWLDRKLHVGALPAATAPATTTVPSATLDHDLTQIGAPAAWNAGFSGKGVSVAILDTGIDTTHPDLQGKVLDAANFSDASDTTDHFGHGTPRRRHRRRDRRGLQWRP